MADPAPGQEFALPSQPPLYHERVTAGVVQQLAILGAAAIFLVAGLVGPGGGGDRIVLASAFLGLGLLVIVVGWVFKDIEIRLWRDRLTIQQGPFTRRVPLDQVRDASFGKRSLWHVKRDEGNLTRNNAAYYVNRFGLAVIVEREDGTPIVFSSKDPRGMAEAIVDAVGKQDRGPTRVGLEEIEERPVA